MRSHAPESRRSTRKAVRATLATATTAALATGLALAGGGAAQAAPVTIDIVDINDFHGRLVRSSSAPAAGAAFVADYVNDVRAQNPNTIFVSGGDNIGASTFESAVQDDEPTIEALDAMGLDVSTVGNHEFDKGFDDLAGRVSDLAEFPYIGANVFLEGTDEHAIDPYSLVEVGGLTVGFVGAVTEQMPSLVSPAGIEGIEFRDIVDSVNAVADDLQDGEAGNGEADVVIALVHEGPASAALEDSTDDSVFGQIVSGLNDNVDAIFSGHTHFRFAHVIEGRPVVQAGQYGEAAARLSFTYDPETDALAFAAPTVTALTVNLGTSSRANWQPIEGLTADPAVDAIVQEAVATAEELGRQPLGEITADFNRAAQAEAVNDSTENRGGESTLGNFVADVQLWATRELDTEVAFMNPGGLRADLEFTSSGTTGDEDGLVTYREAATVQPFANTLVTLEMTGAQIRQVLEEQWQRPANADGPTPSRPFLKLGVSEGLTYTYDPSAELDEHITDIYLNGELLTDDQVVKVVTNSFLASGGDNFFTFADGSNTADSGRVDLAAMVDYFAAQEAAVGPDYAQRAVGVQLSAPAGETYVAGEEVTLDLSSLVFSTNEVKPETVEVSLDGEVLGSGDIDSSIVNTTDEVGRASVTITLPADLASGDYELLVTTPGVGTEAIVPITVAAAATPVDPGQGGDGDGSGDADGDDNGGTGNGAGTGTAGGSTSGNLASTGFDATAAVIPSVIGALVLLLGAGLLVARRAARGRTDEA